MLYFKGCTARERLNNISNSVESILKLFNIDYETLDDEGCCGSVLLRTGFVDEAKELIEKNALEFKGKKILVSCAGCYKTLKQDYSDILGENLEVIHISQFLKELIENKEIKTKGINKNNLKVTYHDSCHLGRHMGEYEAPREVINHFADLCEMVNNKEKAKCCGSGGGVKSAYPEIAKIIAKSRVKEAEETDAELLITTCPFCKLNLDENFNLKVIDLSEFVLNEINSENSKNNEEKN
ncbi:(Fe-S)-binding protein [Methanobrevibacter filiformis]|uniref:Anaerobic glycerol-3-phosphate dehydrogenase subunit C n=1 Tax=Methanobrevibacter filiformis TaxID=55758 RepID=A0A166DLX7_9EURY|nr:(Fe-S)-binding protein [Methanobrevibacter filiformis]KZX15736.1 anaerobic glycerol-3-phosphate dehydrogenase subunit C [Methanobrevibacter filiformis]